VGFALYGDSTDFSNWVEVFVNGVQATYNDPVVGWTITSPTGPLASIPRPVTDGVLTFNLAQTGTIQIVGARRPRRVSQFQEGAGVPARNLNQVLTDIVAMLREDWDKINDVTGRGVFAPPGETMKTLPPAANRANMAATFDGNGNLVPTVPITSGSLTAGPNISLTGSNPTTIDIKPGTANTFKGTLNGSTTSDIALTACTLTYQITKWVAGTGWQCGFNPVLPSRAIAATLNLAAFSTITTQGYTTAGDGGGATYKNAGSSPFVDSYIAGATRVGGSGYVNNGYLGVSLSGGTGHYCNVGATVSGNAVTAVSNAMPCVGYSVGDVLTANNSFLGGSGSGFTWTVTSLSTPQGSFTDSGGAPLAIRGERRLHQRLAVRLQARLEWHRLRSYKQFPLPLGGFCLGWGYQWHRYQRRRLRRPCDHPQGRLHDMRRLQQHVVQFQHPSERSRIWRQYFWDGID
jgi:hypothetical protein